MNLIQHILIALIFLVLLCKAISFKDKETKSFLFNNRTWIVVSIMVYILGYLTPLNYIYTIIISYLLNILVIITVF
ncbi:hypothetical protein SAMN04487772_102113 [[Clostridium] polysaccharolyticum]|uniref:Uncharacterized protein n=1 Tax=[Clostridium] polysaccharolyticum TaxID=29364 RepID=A0A1H9YN90_9FIRM|nr:hypothetical protein SAMN04487772_102113 [[Clostridium] polysaccharolyticum]